MGNVISSVGSGFASVINNIFGSPLDFLSGKQCSSACGPTWDFVCYVENFCVANLLKMAMVFVLLYIVLLFFYLLFKLGICQCICRNLCRALWSCVSAYFHAWEWFCVFLCFKLCRPKTRSRFPRRRYIEEESETSEGEFCYGESHTRIGLKHRKGPECRSLSRRRRDYRGTHMRKSLRPRRSLGVRVGIRRDLGRSDGIRGRRRRRSSFNHGTHGSSVQGIRETRTSKFVRNKRKR